MHWKEALNMRFLGGDVPADKFKRLNTLRFEMVKSNEGYKGLLGTKSRTIRMLVSVFVEFPDVIMELAKKVDKNE